ncbi:MAG: cysteine desulfurase [Candidatus Omnitrophica bacterium]|nr:cysteine desulfurase [Candidatus Omnitrophota bacterium]
MKPARVYLDFLNGSAEAANPSSLYAEARQAAARKETARLQTARLIGSRSDELIFTSCGTEANALALLGLARAHEAKGRHLVVSAIEHLSILHLVRRMEKEGWRVTYLPVDRDGLVDPETLARALAPDTVLVSIQWANPEVGTLQPMAELVRRVKARGILFHTDAIAAVGQVPVDVREIPVDALSLAASTFGGPGGAGALYLKKGVRIQPLLLGGAQEEGRRAGTENLPGIIGMGEASGLAGEKLAESQGRLTILRDRLIQGILARCPEAKINGHPAQRLPGHVSVSFPGRDGETLVLALDLEGIAAGLGSACTSRTMKASHVLKAMGVADSAALGTITFTLGPATTEEEIARVLEVLPGVVEQQKENLVGAR